MGKGKHKESSNSKEIGLGDKVMGEKVDRFVLSQECWAITLEGILALLFGTFVLIMPGITIGWLLIFFCVFVFVWGILEVVASFHADEGRRGILIVKGVSSIAIAILAILWPEISLVVLLYLIMAWLLIRGIYKLVSAFRLPAGDNSKWLVYVDGFLSLIFGVLGIVLPGIKGLEFICLLIGIYMILLGFTLLALAIMVRLDKQAKARRRKPGKHKAR